MAPFGSCSTVIVQLIFIRVGGGGKGCSPHKLLLQTLEKELSLAYI